MKILLNNIDLNQALYGVSNLGFVPTMGSLHKGHISLINRSLKECNKTIVSIFVNPTQFNKKKDYLNYHRNFKKDLQILKKLKVDYLFLPEVDAIYSKKRKTKIKLNKSDNILCAKFRKGHFEGVIDVMDRLSKKIKPKKIYLGEKAHWRLVSESLVTFMASKNLIEKNFNDLEKMGIEWIDPWEKPLHKIYEKNPCLSPIPSLAVHCANINSVFGVSPFSNLKDLWNKTKI